MGQPGDPSPPPLHQDSFEASAATSDELLRQAQRGDREALDRLFERLGAPLRRWATGRIPRWARGAVDTADLVQDVLLRTFRGIDRFEPRRRQALRFYLRAAIQNRVRDAVRRAQVRGPGEVVTAETLMGRDSAFDDIVELENVRRYRSGLARLDPSLQELIVARLELGYSYEQIAEATGRGSPDAARMAIRRALLTLAAEMSSG